MPSHGCPHMDLTSFPGLNAVPNVVGTYLLHGSSTDEQDESQNKSQDLVYIGQSAAAKLSDTRELQAYVFGHSNSGTRIRNSEWLHLANRPHMPTRLNRKSRVCGVICMSFRSLRQKWERTDSTIPCACYTCPDYST